MTIHASMEEKKETAEEILDELIDQKLEELIERIHKDDASEFLNLTRDDVKEKIGEIWKERFTKKRGEKKNGKNQD